VGRSRLPYEELLNPPGQPISPMEHSSKLKQLERQLELGSQTDSFCFERAILRGTLLLVTAALCSLISLPIASVRPSQSICLADMNITTALTSVAHYAQANPGTVTMATGSVAIMACPALLSVAVFNAAGLGVGGPVAGDPRRCRTHHGSGNLIVVQVVHLQSCNQRSAGPLRSQPYFKVQPWAGMVLPSSTE
jgi:hypothetical protein